MKTITLSTDAWSEKARQASAEARRRKSTSGELSAKIIPPSRKKIPRGQIEWVVNKYHVSKPESEVRSEFEKRLEKADWPPSKKREAVEYAVKHHRKNQGLYGKVMGGRI